MINKTFDEIQEKNKNRTENRVLRLEEAKSNAQTALKEVREWGRQKKQDIASRGY